LRGGKAVFIGVYLCGSLFIGVLALVLLHLRSSSASARALVRPYVRRYIILATLLSLMVLLLFIVLSVWTGVIQAGQPQQVNVPDDYLAAGAAGWLMLALLLLGAFSPWFVAVVISRWVRSRSGSER
jgi:hypothetical protein